MSFDPQLKELARGHDAVDCLRETQLRMVERKEAAVARRDLLLRAVALIAVFWLVNYAIMRL